ncbi:hypothetical protein VCHA53O466_50147 [Vibrio chagasii]|nr:hypothetical protein VCHA53O466_50147 [Vibrio chagasii]
MVDTSYIRALVCSLSESGSSLEEDLFAMIPKYGIEVDIDYAKDVLGDLVLEGVISHDASRAYTLTPKGESMISILKCDELLIVLRLTGANRSVKVFCNRLIEMQRSLLH